MNTTVLVFLLITHWAAVDGRSLELEPMPSISVCEQVAEKVMASKIQGRHGFEVECIQVKNN